MTAGTYSPSIEDGALLTYDEAAARAGVATATVRKWVAREHLPSVIADGVVLVPERKLLECERDRRRSGRRRKSGRVSEVAATGVDVSH